MNPILPGAVVALTLLAGCSGAPEVGGSSAQCADVVRYDGHTYWAHGDPARTPDVTGRTGTGLRLGCDDGSGRSPDEKIAVEELADLPLERGFLGGGRVYLRRDLPLPEAIRVWFREPGCTGDGPLTLTGRWLGVSSPRRARFDGDIRPPYRLTMRVEHGPRRYVGTRITVRGDGSTDPGLGPDDARRALWHDGTLTATVHCEGARFVADALATATASRTS